MFLIVFTSCLVAFLVSAIVRWLVERAIKHVDKQEDIFTRPVTQRTCRECYLPVHRYRINFDKSVTCANCISEGK